MSKMTGLKIIGVVAFAAAVGLATYYLKNPPVQNHSAPPSVPGVTPDVQAAIDNYVRHPMTRAEIQKMLDEGRAAQTRPAQSPK